MLAFQIASELKEPLEIATANKNVAFVIAMFCNKFFRPQFQDLE